MVVPAIQLDFRSYSAEKRSDGPVFFSTGGSYQGEERPEIGRRYGLEGKE